MRRLRDWLNDLVYGWCMNRCWEEIDRDDSRTSNLVWRICLDHVDEQERDDI